ncbi:MAG: tRNA 2-thiouridine(34) synthase MnmA [Clostridia bacterium]|nr:tRNA 2-thiouridine(34) synthase MnmA [Clostridia bacterium]
MSSKKALIAMSGGIDSSVAALLTKNQGYDCIGCTMKLYNNEDANIPKEHTCCSLDDVEDARNVAYKLGIPYYVFNFTDDFKEKVIDKFIKCYECGITPNPCIDCNRYIKFDKLYHRARVLGCDYIVTGHYARIEFDSKKYILKKAIDETKDQSYVLYSMTQEQLKHTLFPLGSMTKTETRKIANENNFINSNKPDSQDICFVPNGDYASVIENYTGKKYTNGNFINTSGEIIGKHKGIINYTIGQRKGLGISSKEPLYVCKIDAKNNTVTLGNDKELFESVVLVKDFNWIMGKPLESEIKCKVKVRYRQNEQSATLILLENNEVKIIFDEPQRAITPGQAAVAYLGDIVLGGGVIENVN